MSKLGTVIKNPKALFYGLGLNGYLNFLPDDIYLKIMFKLRMGEKLHLNNPITYNEKLQWIKINDRKPEYTMMADKYEVRKYIAETIGDEYLIPLIGVYNTPEEILWDKLPDKFVIKCTHGSHSNIICTDKSKLNIEQSVKNLNKWMKMNWFWFGREWVYKDIKPRIIAEEFMSDKPGEEIRDYKIMCFNGEPKCSFVCTDRSIGDLKVTFFDLDWKVMDFERHYHKSSVPIPCPATYGKMIELARILSKNIPFVRVDFYEIKGKVYFGELTFFPGCGFEEFTPHSADELLGSWIDLK